MMRLVILSCFFTLCASQKWNQETSRMEAKGPNSGKTCSNLTQVLDNWKFAILTQVKDMLINDHSSVLPEYSRIPPLSDALGDLYNQFNKLKEELRALTANVDKVEAAVDEIKHDRFFAGRPIQRVPPGTGLRSPLRAQMRAPERRVTAQLLRRARWRGSQKN